jgi:hypothetical protein
MNIFVFLTFVTTAQIWLTFALTLMPTALTLTAHGRIYVRMYLHIWHRISIIKRKHFCLKNVFIIQKICSEHKNDFYIAIF